MEHAGATSGFSTSMSFLPDQKWGLIVFSNLDEIFRIDKTLSIKNQILRNLVDYHSPSISKITVPTSQLNKIRGTYGPYPGILTNTRVPNGWS